MAAAAADEDGGDGLEGGRRAGVLAAAAAALVARLRQVLRLRLWPAGGTHCHAVAGADALAKAHCRRA